MPIHWDAQPLDVVRPAAWWVRALFVVFWAAGAAGLAWGVYMSLGGIVDYVLTVWIHTRQALGG